MDLKAYQPRRNTVAVPTNAGTETMTVYGLEFIDICLIVRENRELVESLFGLAIDQNPASPITVDTIINRALVEAPLMVGAIIAYGAKQPDAFEQVLSLPIAVQFEAVEKILMLTAEGDYGLKKVMETVGSVLKASQNQSEPARSESGS